MLFRSLVAVGELRVAAARELAAVRRQTPVRAVAALFLERDQLETALADTPLQAGAAVRRQSPLNRVVLPACDHAWKMAAHPPGHNYGRIVTRAFPARIGQRGV